MFNNTYETIAGFILEHLGHLPEEGKVLSWRGYAFQIFEVEQRRIKKIKVSLDA